MKNRFEQLIEYVINDEEAKAKELFHQIVVEKSRSIYESLMDEDQQIEEDDAMGRMDRYDETMGGDQADDLIDDVEAEEAGLNMEDEEEDMDAGEEVVDGDEEEMDVATEFGDEGGEEDLEDRVVDLEDKLDELMAEFEAMMGSEAGPEEEMDAMDSPDMTGMEVDDDELETEGMMEAVSLKAAPKPVTSEEGGINTKTPVAANSGAKGMASSPVKMTGDTAQGRPAPTTKDLIGKVGNSPAQGTQQPKPAAKPHLAQATGVNAKSPLPKQ
jgi:hypothetical protein